MTKYKKFNFIHGLVASSTTFFTHWIAWILRGPAYLLLLLKQCSFPLMTVREKPQHSSAQFRASDGTLNHKSNTHSAE